MITVIMHLYNEAQHLETVLQSIYNQTHPPDNYYLVDDGSTDETTDIIKATGHPYTRLEPHPNTPHYIRRATAFNAAVDGARHNPTDYILKVDGDTVIEPRYVETLLPYMRNPVCAAASGKSTEYDKIRDLNNGAVLYRNHVLPRAQKVYGWDRDIQLQLLRAGYSFIVDPTIHYTDLRPPTVLKPKLTRVIRNRANKAIAEITGAARRII